MGKVADNNKITGMRPLNTHIYVFILQIAKRDPTGPKNIQQRPKLSLQV